MRQFQTYLFDFDGTLVDSYESLVKVFEGAYSKVGVTVPEGYTLRLMRCPLYVGYQGLNGPDDEESKNYNEECPVHCLNKNCSFDDGTCISYKKGFYCDKCEEECSDACGLEESL